MFYFVMKNSTGKPTYIRFGFPDLDVLILSKRKSIAVSIYKYYTVYINIIILIRK